MKVGDFVKYELLDIGTSQPERGTAIIYQQVSNIRFRVFTNRGDVIDIRREFMEVISAGR